MFALPNWDPGTTGATLAVQRLIAPSAELPRIGQHGRRTPQLLVGDVLQLHT